MFAWFPCVLTPNTSGRIGPCSVRLTHQRLPSHQHMGVIARVEGIDTSGCDDQTAVRSAVLNSWWWVGTYDNSLTVDLSTAPPKMAS